MFSVIILTLYMFCIAEGNQGCSSYDVPLSASLPNSNFQASSVLDPKLNQPYMAKIGGNKEWCPSAAAAGSEFIQIDLSTPFRVCAVETQGHHTLFWFVSSYQVTYSLNGSTWFNVTLENKTVLVFPGNADGGSVVRNKLNDSSSFVTRFIRLYPLTFSTWPCLRVEIYGRELPALDNRFPRNKTVTEGNSFTIQCRPLGNTGKFNVTWITNSGSNTSFPVSVNLTINATRFDAGEYHCIVTNGVESVKSPTVYVDVLYPPSLDATHPRNHTVVEGFNFTLQCKVTGANPKANIAWYNVSTNRTVISYRDSLTFLNITQFQAGKYQCVADNGIGQAAVSRISTVDVQYSPSLNASYPRDHTVEEGTNLTLQCKLTAANPLSNITWYNASSNSTTLAMGKNFTFQNILRSAAGQYYCVAENGVGQATISRISSVDVLYPPQLNPNYPKDHTTNEGEAISLRCVIESSHPDPNITWVKLNESEEAFPWGSILNLTNVTQDDGGKYYCLADNGVVGQVESRSAELEVKGTKRRNKEVGTNAAQKTKRTGLVIILLSLTVAFFTVGLLMLVIFCVFVHKNSGYFSAGTR